MRDLAKLFEDGGRACVEVRDLAQLQLDQVRARLDAMRQLEAKLAQFVASCDATCVGGTTSGCVIIGDIAAAPGSFSSTELRRT